MQIIRLCPTFGFIVDKNILDIPFSELGIEVVFSGHNS